MTTKLTFISATRDVKVIYCDSAERILVGRYWKWACLNGSMITWVNTQDWTLISIEEA